MQDETLDKGTVAAIDRFTEHIKKQAQDYLTVGQQLAAAAEAISKMEPKHLEGLFQPGANRLTAGLERIKALGGLPAVFPPTAFETIGKVGGLALAMDITGKSKSTIYNLVSQGKIPVAKNGGRLQFSEEALRAYSFQPRYSMGADVPYPGARASLIEGHVKKKSDEANADQ